MLPRDEGERPDFCWKPEKFAGVTFPRYVLHPLSANTRTENLALTSRD